MIRTARRHDQPSRHLQVLPRHQEVSFASMVLTVSRPFGGAVALVVVAGEVDMLTAPLLERVAVAEVDPDTAVLLLDMAQVGSFGASGLGALLQLLDAVERMGVRLCVVCPSRPVCRVLDLVALADRFDVHPMPTAPLDVARTR